MVTGMARGMTREEQISALIDGALDGSEEKFLMRQLAADKEARTTTSRYFMIGEALRGQLHTPVDLSFADRVMAEINKEAGGQATDSTAKVVALAQPEESHTAVASEEGNNVVKSVSWGKPVIGFALAASLAMIAVFLAPIGGQTIDGGNDLNGLSASLPGSSTAVSFQDSSQQDVQVDWWLAEPTAEQRMSNYMFQRGAEGQKAIEEAKQLEQQVK